MFITKKFEYLLIFFFGALVSAGGFFWSAKNEIQLPETEVVLENSDSDVDDWGSFKNEEYGFEVKFPKDWSDGTNWARPFYTHRVFCPPEFADSKSNNGCKWEKDVNGAQSTPAPIFFYVEDWDTLKGNTKEEKKGISWCKIEKMEKINGIDMQFVDCGGNKRAYWENPAGSHLFKLFLMNSKYQKEFDLMVLAFRFLD